MVSHDLFKIITPPNQIETNLFIDYPNQMISLSKIALMVMVIDRI